MGCGSSGGESFLFLAEIRGFDWGFGLMALGGVEIMLRQAIENCGIWVR